MSKIEVNEIDAQSGSTITVGSACKSVAVPGNVVKTNAVQASDAGNIISQSGTTITIGASGDTVSLASGASQSGFGRSGSVDWQTGSIKTSTFTAANGEGYFVDTSSGAVTANLPAGSAGAIVAFADYTRTFQTNNFTITPNGSEKIGGVNASVVSNIEGQALTLVYVDGTEGWINVQNAEDTETGVPPFVAATGGTVLTVGNFKTHVFTGPGTFCVSNAGLPTGSNTMDYFVVAGGGGGSPGYAGGGGGGGGFRLSNSVGCLPAPSMSPLANPTGLPVSVQAYPITVGAGGGAASQGSSSIFSSITSAGGGRSNGASDATERAGGSGGGGAQSGTCRPGGAGNTPPVSPPQGNPGGNTAGGGNSETGGGGGGANSLGPNGSSGGPTGSGGQGSNVSDSFFGPTSPSYGEDFSPVVADTRAFAGGGGAGGAGGVPVPSYGAGGRGGGGPSPAASPCGSGVANQGGGGGGGGDPNNNGGSGGSGFVAIRYKFQ